jgi:hypothetical protein
MTHQKIVLVVLFFLFPFCSLWSQTPVTGAERLAFTHDGINTDRYELKLDAGVSQVVTATPLPTVPGDFTIPLPAMTPGVHSLIVSACNFSGCASAPVLSVRVVILPGIPVNVRVIP